VIYYFCFCISLKRDGRSRHVWWCETYNLSSSGQKYPILSNIRIFIFIILNFHTRLILLKKDWECISQSRTLYTHNARRPEIRTIPNFQYNNHVQADARWWYTIMHGTKSLILPLIWMVKYNFKSNTDNNKKKCQNRRTEYASWQSFQEAHGFEDGDMHASSLTSCRVSVFYSC
jgi:hypothetical protein